jgi:hypothetical protein
MFRWYQAGTRDDNVQFLKILVKPEPFGYVNIEDRTIATMPAGPRT